MKLWASNSKTESRITVIIMFKVYNLVQEEPILPDL